MVSHIDTPESSVGQWAWYGLRTAIGVVLVQKLSSQWVSMVLWGPVRSSGQQPGWAPSYLPAVVEFKLFPKLGDGCCGHSEVKGMARLGTASQDLLKRAACPSYGDVCLVMTWDGGAGSHLVADSGASRYRGNLDGKEAFHCLGY